MQRHTPMKRTTPLRRSSALLCRKRMQQRVKGLTAAERRVYAEATENARDAFGVLICARCSLPIRDGDEHRHHVIPRGRGGFTTVQNLAIEHWWCHLGGEHGQFRVQR